jgi:hypothetical protein
MGLLNDNQNLVKLAYAKFLSVKYKSNKHSKGSYLGLIRKNLCMAFFFLVISSGSLVSSGGLAIRAFGKCPMGAPVLFHFSAKSRSVNIARTAL